MDKQEYDKIRLQETQEKEKVAQTKKIKKYAKIVLWIIALVFVLGGSGWYMAKSGFFSYDPLNLCVQHTGIGIHIHPHIKIFVKGEEIKIPTNIGITANCMKPVHTHDESGTLHLEFPNGRDVALGDFFKIWKKEFDWTKIQMTVNRQENTEMQNYKMQDKDQIELRFE